MPAKDHAYTPPTPVVTDDLIAAVAEKAAAEIWRSPATREYYATIVRAAIREALGRG